MRILSKISICIFICLCMVSCSSNEAMAPASASDYSKGDFQKAADSFERAGFTNIQLIAIDDLTSSSTVKDGTILKISIDGTTSFESMQLFPKDAPVIIEYHNIPKLVFPVKEEDIQSESYDVIAQEFEKAGFIDITTEESYDLDPDIEEKDCINEILINGSKDYNLTDVIPFDAKIIIRAHYKYAKFTATINIDCANNFMFNRYDVSILIDDNEQVVLPHGENDIIERRMKEGKHTITFQNVDDDDIKGTAEIDVKSNLETSYSIKCFGDYIKVENNYTDYDTVLEKGQVKILNSKDHYLGRKYDEVEKELLELGFKNVKLCPSYDIDSDDREPGLVNEVLIDSNDDYRRGEVFQDDVDINIHYSMRVEDDPIYIAEQKRKEEEERRKREEETFEVVTYGVYDDQPINWYVLKKDEDKTLLIADRVIRKMSVRNWKEGHNSTWAISDIREYLNGLFYNHAFSDDEKDGIISTTVKDGGEETNDKVILLTSEQARTYFPSNRSRKPVDGGEWWLLDNGPLDIYKRKVNNKGSAYDYQSGIEPCGVRPAIWVSNEYLE